jgi:hypothetical protein
MNKSFTSLRVHLSQLLVMFVQYATRQSLQVLVARSQSGEGCAASLQPDTVTADRAAGDGC